MMKIRLLKLLPIMILALVLAFSSGSTLLAAYAELDQPDDQNYGADLNNADLSYNEETGNNDEQNYESNLGSSEINDVSGFANVTFGIMAYDEPLAEGGITWELVVTNVDGFRQIPLDNKYWHQAANDNIAFAEMKAWQSGNGPLVFDDRVKDLTLTTDKQTVTFTTDSMFDGCVIEFNVYVSTPGNSYSIYKITVTGPGTLTFDDFGDNQIIIGDLNVIYDDDDSEFNGNLTMAKTVDGIPIGEWELNGYVIGDISFKLFNATLDNDGIPQGYEGEAIATAELTLAGNILFNSLPNDLNGWYAVVEFLAPASKAEEIFEDVGPLYVFFVNGIGIGGAKTDFDYDAFYTIVNGYGNGYVLGYPGLNNTGDIFTIGVKNADTGDVYPSFCASAGSMAFAGQSGMGCSGYYVSLCDVPNGVPYKEFLKAYNYIEGVYGNLDKYRGITQIVTWYLLGAIGDLDLINWTAVETGTWAIKGIVDARDKVEDVIANYGGFVFKGDEEIIDVVFLTCEDHHAYHDCQPQLVPVRGGSSFDNKTGGGGGEEEPYELTINKVGSGAGFIDGTFYFRLEEFGYNEQQEEAWILVPNGDETLFSVTTTNGSGSITIDVPAGLYRITELNANGTAVTYYTVSYSVTDRIVEVGEEAGAAITVTNTRGGGGGGEEEPYELTINKVGSGAGFTNGTFYFLVERRGYNEQQEEVWTPVPNGDEPLFSVTTTNGKGSITIDVPAGLYRVTEVNANGTEMSYYTVEYSHPDQDGKHGIVEVLEWVKNSATSITVTNTRGGSGGGGGNDRPPTGGGGGGTVIDDDNVPTTDIPEPKKDPEDIPEVIVPPVDVPLGEIPQTGDKGVSPILLALFCAAITGMNTTIQLARKSRA